MGFINQLITGGPHIVGYMHTLSNLLAIQKIISPSSFFAPGTRATSVLSCVPMGRRCALTPRGSPIWYLDLEDAWRVLGFFSGLDPLERPWNMLWHGWRWFIPIRNMVKHLWTWWWTFIKMPWKEGSGRFCLWTFRWMVAMKKRLAACYHQNDWGLRFQFPLEPIEWLKIVWGLEVVLHKVVPPR